MSARFLIGFTCIGLLFSGSGGRAADAAERSAGAGGSRYNLRYKYQPGQTVAYAVSTSMEYTIQVSGTADTAWSKSEARRHYRVQSVDERGAGVLELAIDRVQMSDQKSSTSTVEEFDSNDPAKQPPKYKHILDRIGKSQATLHVTPQGKPVKVVPNAPVEANKAVSLSPDASPESFLTVLPDHPIAVGDEWKERFEVNARDADRLAMAVKLLRVYRLEEVKEGIARISYTTTILTPVRDPSISVQLIQRETSGYFEFDLNAGIIVSRVAEIDRTVVGAFGEKSSLRAVTKYVERQVPSDQQARSPQRTPRL